MTAFTLFGVALSAQAMLVLGGLEVLIFLALGVSGLVSPGPGGFNFSSFNPGNIPSARRAVPGRGVHDPGAVGVRIGRAAG